MPYAEHEHVQIYYETFGHADDPCLLLVNGLGSQCINYHEDWCNMFADRGLFVVRYDNRDVGLSTKFDDWPTGPHGAAYTFSDMAADGMVVLDTLGVKRAHVMGLSMGGMIVQTMAIEHPHRLITMTSVMSTTGEPEFRRQRAGAGVAPGPIRPRPRGFVQEGSTAARGAAPSSPTSPLAGDGRARA
jgi:pimeloyl-ACP methyl ester carboxylesterase